MHNFNKPNSSYPALKEYAFHYRADPQKASVDPSERYATLDVPTTVSYIDDSAVATSTQPYGPFISQAASLGHNNHLGNYGRKNIGIDSTDRISNLIYHNPGLENCGCHEFGSVLTSQNTDLSHENLGRAAHDNYGHASEFVSQNAGLGLGCLSIGNHGSNSFDSAFVNQSLNSSYSNAGQANHGDSDFGFGLTTRNINYSYGDLGAGEHDNYGLDSMSQKIGLGHNNLAMRNHNSSGFDPSTVSQGIYSDHNGLRGEVALFNNFDFGEVGFDNDMNGVGSQLDFTSVLAPTAKNVDVPASFTTSNVTNNTSSQNVCCGKTFTRPSDRTRHARKHAPDGRVYHCTFPGCRYSGERGFYRKDKLDSHMKKHTQGQRKGNLD